MDPSDRFWSHKIELSLSPPPSLLFPSPITGTRFYHLLKLGGQFPFARTFLVNETRARFIRAISRTKVIVPRGLYETTWSRYYFKVSATVNVSGNDTDGTLFVAALMKPFPRGPARLFTDRSVSSVFPRAGTSQVITRVGDEFNYSGSLPSIACSIWLSLRRLSLIICNKLRQVTDFVTSTIFVENAIKKLCT